MILCGQDSVWFGNIIAVGWTALALRVLHHVVAEPFICVAVGLVVLPRPSTLFVVGLIALLGTDYGKGGAFPDKLYCMVGAGTKHVTKEAIPEHIVAKSPYAVLVPDTPEE